MASRFGRSAVLPSTGNFTDTARSTDIASLVRVSTLFPLSSIYGSGQKEMVTENPKIRPHDDEHEAASFFFFLHSGWV